MDIALPARQDARIVRRLAQPLLLAVLAALLLAAPAAEAAGGPKARADAQRLAELYSAFDRAMNRLGRTHEDAIDEEIEACAAKHPDVDSDATVYRLVSLYLRAIIARGDRRLASVTAKLEAFRTRDRAVRRVARRLASSLTVVRALGTSPPRPCPYLEAWEAAGWSSDFRISPPVRNLTPEEIAGLREDGRVGRRAARRLRALGVSKARVDQIVDLWGDRDIWAKLAL